MEGGRKGGRERGRERRERGKGGGRERGGMREREGGVNITNSIHTPKHLISCIQVACMKEGWGTGTPTPSEWSSLPLLYNEFH